MYLGSSHCRHVGIIDGGKLKSKEWNGPLWYDGHIMLHEYLSLG
jgi:hypothetical protein